jgi:hypothetical protein
MNPYAPIRCGPSSDVPESLGPTTSVFSMDGHLVSEHRQVGEGCEDVDDVCDPTHGSESYVTSRRASTATVFVGRLSERMFSCG